MKKFKEVEADRKRYHANPLVNSVHRSSLLVPEISGAVAEISFLNHFLLKRKYEKVGCRITAVDEQGRRIGSLLYSVTEPRVYSFTLTGLFEKPVNTYQVEFFSGENLFIPFPAVIVNHHGDGFLNQVHSYNRILNDVFEDDSINTECADEISLDVNMNDGDDAFFMFTSGMFEPKDKIGVELYTPHERYYAEVEPGVARMGSRSFSVREIFSQLPKHTRAVMKIRQPRQDMFYSRILAGMKTASGLFSANHTYYDLSKTEEYWENGTPSSRTYPFFAELQNSFRIYPVMSPGNYEFVIQFNDLKGVKLKEINLGKLTSPGNQLLEPNLNDLASKAEIPLRDISSCTLTAKPVEGAFTPTRMNHQQVYDSGGLATSINVSLLSSNVHNPSGKKTFIWGQGVVSEDLNSWIGLVADDVDGNIPVYDVNLKIYGPNGILAQKSVQICSKSSYNFSLKELIEHDLNSLGMNRPQYLWYVAESEQFGLSATTVTVSRKTGHCSGEHNF